MDKMIGSYEVRDNDLFNVITDVRNMTIEERSFLSIIDLGKVAGKLGYNGSLFKDDRPNGTGFSFSNDAVKMVCLLKNYNPSEAECFLFKNFNIKDKSVLYSRVVEKATKCLESLGGLSEYVKFKLFRKTISQTSRGKKIVFKGIGTKYNSNYTFTYNEAKYRLASLLIKNMMGEDVFIEPVSNRYSFIVINNVYKQDLDRMIKDNVVPNIVLNIAWNRYQTIFAFPNHLPEEIFKSFSEEVALKYGGTLSNKIFNGHNLIYVPGTQNMDDSVLKHNCHPDIDFEMEPNTILSDGLKRIEYDVLKKPHVFFENLQNEIRDFQGFITNLKMDTNIAKVMRVLSKENTDKNNRLDMYFSDEEQIAMLIGNGLNEKVKSGNVGYIDYNILDKISEEIKKQYKPIIDTKLFSKPEPFFKKDDNKINEEIIEEENNNKIENNNSEKMEEKSQKKFSLFSKLFGH